MIMTEEEMDEQLELLEDYDPWDDDDYYIDEDGELQCRCDDCPFNGLDDDEWQVEE